MTSIFSGHALRGLLLGVTLTLSTQLSTASVLSYSGVFATDDALFSQAFTLNTAGLVTLNTLSYAGGTNSLGAAVAAGGFASSLSLFDQASGALIQWANAAGCASPPVDPITGFAWDACISTNLVVGSYLLVLSQSGNDPLGDIVDGFSQTGNPNFTAINGLDPNAMFVDVGGAQRNGHWAFDVTIPDDPTPALPEPSSMALLAAALLGLRLSGLRLSGLRLPCPRHPS